MRVRVQLVSEEGQPKVHFTQGKAEGVGLATIQSGEGIHIFRTDGDEVGGNLVTVVQLDGLGALFKGKPATGIEEVEKADVDVAAGLDDFAFLTLHLKSHSRTAGTDKDINGLRLVVDHDFECSGRVDDFCEAVPGKFEGGVGDGGASGNGDIGNVFPGEVAAELKVDLFVVPEGDINARRCKGKGHVHRGLDFSFGSPKVDGGCGVILVAVVKGKGEGAALGVCIESDALLLGGGFLALGFVEWKGFGEVEAGKVSGYGFDVLFSGGVGEGDDVVGVFAVGVGGIVGHADVIRPKRGQAFEGSLDVGGHGRGVGGVGDVDGVVAVQFNVECAGGVSAVRGGGDVEGGHVGGCEGAAELYRPCTGTSGNGCGCPGQAGKCGVEGGLDIGDGGAVVDIRGGVAGTAVVKTEGEGTGRVRGEGNGLDFVPAGNPMVEDNRSDFATGEVAGGVHLVDVDPSEVVDKGDVVNVLPVAVFKESDVDVVCVRTEDRGESGFDVGGVGRGVRTGESDCLGQAPDAEVIGAGSPWGGEEEALLFVDGGNGTGAGDDAGRDRRRGNPWGVEGDLLDLVDPGNGGDRFVDLGCHPGGSGGDGQTADTRAFKSADELDGEAGIAVATDLDIACPDPSEGFECGGDLGDDFGVGVGGEDGGILAVAPESETEGADGVRLDI